MEPHTPLSARHLYALLGDKMHSFPPHFIERLEWHLEAFETSRSNRDRVVHLRSVPDVANDAPMLGVDGHAELERHGKVTVPIRTLQGLAAILELLHSAHLGRHDGGPEGRLSEHLVEGLIVSGRALVEDAADAIWDKP